MFGVSINLLRSYSLSIAEQVLRYRFVKGDEIKEAEIGSEILLKVQTDREWIEEKER